jgi:hypothetical protein
MLARNRDPVHTQFGPFLKEATGFRNPQYLIPVAFTHPASPFTVAAEASIPMSLLALRGVAIPTAQ